MIVFHDYECRNGHRQIDVAHKQGNAPRQVACPDCDEKADMLFGTRCNIITDESPLYGRFDPQYGQVVRGYSHKKQLQKQMGLIDADDPVKGDRERMDTPIGGTGKGIPKEAIITNDLSTLGIDDGTKLEAVDPD